MRRVWAVREVDPAGVAALSSALGVTERLAGLLWTRQVRDVEQGRAFLEPSLGALHDPGELCDMRRVVERLARAVATSERICIWGDYDVDGVTSTALLWGFLRELGASPEFYIPFRLEEGYGLNVQALERLRAGGVELVVAVDCGISDHQPIRRAAELGLDVVVIDHHQVPDELPSAAGILNPRRADCAFPAKELAAVGVVFNLLMALRAELRARGAFEGRAEPNLRRMLDLVALGTVADVVPLLGENRVVTCFGLAELAAGRRPGIAALKEVAGLTGPRLSAADVAFRLAPRINALGRLGRAAGGVELLTTDSYARALALAREMEEANLQRRALEQHIQVQACAQADAAMAAGRPPALVLADEGWHTGVIGIVASRLVERYGRPVILVGQAGEPGRGSARGIEGVHLFEALRACESHLAAYGGHRLAAGLSVTRTALDGFRRAFLREVDRQLGGLEPVRAVQVDGLVQPGAWSPEEVAALARLEPFGAGNPEPIFWARALDVRGARLVGSRPPLHVKAGVEDQGRTFELIWFRQAERLDELRRDRVDVLYTPGLNTWNGQTSIQLKVLDVRPAEG
jgi:single-stranded-DNA-specific exonuclease